MAGGGGCARSARLSRADCRVESAPVAGEPHRADRSLAARTAGRGGGPSLADRSQREFLLHLVRRYFLVVHGLGARGGAARRTATGDAMKICQVLCSRGTGGLERHFVDLCNARAERHELIAIAHPEFRDRLHARVALEPLDLSGWRRNPATLLRLYVLLRRHRPQIIHAQANKAAAMLATLRPFLPARCWVATVHNLKRDTRLFRGYDALIAVSKQVAAQFARPRVEVVYNGIDPATVRAVSNADELRTLVGGLWGLFCFVVGWLVFVLGFVFLLRVWTEIDASLFIVGDGPERSRQAALLRDLEIGQRVRLLGFRRDRSG